MTSIQSYRLAVCSSRICYLLQDDVSVIACTVDSNRVSKVEQFYAKDKGGVQSVSTGPINSGDSEAAIKSGSPKTMSCRFTYDNAIAKTETDKVGNLYCFRVLVWCELRC